MSRMTCTAPFTFTVWPISSGFTNSLISFVSFLITPLNYSMFMLLSFCIVFPRIALLPFSSRNSVNTKTSRKQEFSLLFRDGIFSYSRGATRSCTRLCMQLLYLTRTTYRFTYLSGLFDRSAPECSPLVIPLNNALSRWRCIPVRFLCRSLLHCFASHLCQSY